MLPTNDTMKSFIIRALFISHLMLSTLAFTFPATHLTVVKSVDKETCIGNRSGPFSSRCRKLLFSNCYRYHQSSPANLVPFSEAWNADNEGLQSSSFASLLHKIGCLSLNSDGMLTLFSDDENEHYRLYLATDADDLPPIAKLTVDVFDATAIALSSTTSWSVFEKALLGAVVEPAIGMYNAWAHAVGYTEVLSGLRRRMRNRMTDTRNGGEKNDEWFTPLVVPNNDTSKNDSLNKCDKTLEDIASRSSLILALARSPDGGKDMEVVASVELRLQPTDAKIPFSQPWLDNMERRLVRSFPFLNSKLMTNVTGDESVASDDDTTKVEIGKSKNPPMRPYLCNLCVTPNLRSLGIGRALCRIVEAIAQKKWSYSHIYLHVDPTNDVAMKLYEKEGYVDVGRRWNTFWAGGEISYYVKRLRG
jgi:ribosomal protein S18 acetylase RimI-like enzyme